MRCTPESTRELEVSEVPGTTDGSPLLCMSSSVAGGPYTSWEFAVSDSKLPSWTREALERADRGIARREEGTTFRSEASEKAVHYRSFVSRQAQSLFHVFVFHGLAEHSQKFSYTRLAEALNAAGMHVHMADMQAHGYSESYSPQYIHCWEHLSADALQFVSEVLKEQPAEARCAFLSFSTGGAIGFHLCGESLSRGHPLHGKLMGHYAMAPLTTNPAPGLVQVLVPVLACCCATKRIPYMTDRQPWLSFANSSVYKLEVTDDALNWGNGKDGTHALGNLVVVGEASAASLAGISKALGKVPIKVVYGNRDGILPQGRKDAEHLFQGKAKTELEIIPELPHCVLQTADGERLQREIVTWFASKFSQ